jgi:hypothetical protein
MDNDTVQISYTALGVLCAVKGAILEKWQSLGAQNGLLGYPVDGERTYRDGACSMRFQRGSIYSHPEYGTHYIAGRIYRHWADELGVYGKYGFLAGDPEKCGENGTQCRQVFARGTLDDGQSDICEGSDLRGEIARRGIQVRNQGKRGTCSVQTMVFLMEYQYAGLLGNAWGHLSVEYANHFANVAENIREDGHYFSSIAAGYESFGIVKDLVWPYNKEWAYDYDQGCRLAGEDKVGLGRQMLVCGLRLRGRFIKELGGAGLSEPKFDECIAMLDAGIPVGIGRDHSMALVGYRRDAAMPGGGVMIFRNSYGADGDFTGYQVETFEHVKTTVFDAYIYTI